MNTTANINYLAGRYKAGFDTSSLSKGDRQAYDLVADTTENFTTDFDLIDEDPNAVQILDNLVAAMKASAGPEKSKKKPLNPKRKLHAIRTKGKAKKVKRAQATRATSAGRSFAERMRKAKEAKASQSAETEDSTKNTAQSTTAGAAKKPRKARVAKEKTVNAKAEKPAKVPDKKTAAYLDAIKSKSLPFEVGLIRTFINLVHHSTKEKIVAALTTFQKSFHAGKWNRNSVFIDELRAIQKEYLDVLNDGKAPYTIAVNPDKLAKLVRIVGGEKVFKSVALLNKFVNWTNTAKNEKQIHSLLTEAQNAVKKGKIDPRDPYADKIGEIIHVLEKAKAGQTFKAEATSLNGLAGLLGCSCHQAKPLSGTRTRKPAAAKKKARTKSVSGLGSVENTIVATSPRLKADGPKAFPGLISSEQIMTTSYPVYTFAQPWGKLFGEPQTNANVMVWGEPGQGKSTFGFKLARYLATSHGPVLYVSSEEIRDGMPSFTIKKKLDMAGGSVPGWDFAGDLSKLGARHKFLIVDSVNDSGMTREQLKTLKKAHPGLFVVLIFQATKEGKFKGENDWSHDVDVVLEVAGGNATTTKNRFAELTTIKIF